MKNFDRIFTAVIAVIAAVFAGTNIFLILAGDSGHARPYRVEISRIATAIREEGYDAVRLSEYQYVTDVIMGGEDIFDADSDYVVREIGGVLYRFDYSAGDMAGRGRLIGAVNLALGIMALVLLAVLVFVRQKILRPFEQLADVPYQLSKGKLTVPLKENRSRFFGRFVWGVDLLRECMEQQRERELALQKSQKTLLLSLSHDIKMPLSAIRLYAGALSKKLYAGEEGQLEIADKIGAKAEEIGGYVSQIVNAAREDILSLEVCMGEFYLSALVAEIKKYYVEKLALVKTDFLVGAYDDCLLCGDFDRSVEVLQNIMENAIKYGDGNRIELCFSQEEGCVLVAVKMSGCTLLPEELPHIFESFWRGSNAGGTKGSGLGLYICKKLMHQMSGEIFAQILGNDMVTTAVFGKAS